MSAEHACPSLDYLCGHPDCTLCADRPAAEVRDTRGPQPPAPFELRYVVRDGLLYVAPRPAR